MTNTYSLTGSRFTGSIELQYTDAVLNCIKIEVKEPLNEKQFRALLQSVPQHEGGLEALKQIGLTAKQELTSNMKLALFCRFYLQYKGIKYIVSAADSGKIKLVKIDEEMMTVYFTSETFEFKNKQSISNLVKYYNQLRAEVAAGPKTKSKYPDHYSAEYEKKLSDKEASEYWQHLHACGLQPKRDRFNKIVDWERKEI